MDHIILDLLEGPSLPEWTSETDLLLRWRRGNGPDQWGGKVSVSRRSVSSVMIGELTA